MTLRQRAKTLKKKSRLLARSIYHLRYLHPVLATVGKTGQGFARDDCMIMAAAVAFYAILSLIPFLLLLLSISGYILDNLAQDYASRQDLLTHLTTYIRAAVPFISDDVMHRLEGMISNRQAFGISGLLILFLTAGFVFRSLELAFSRVFQSPRRSMVTSQLLFIVFLFGIGLLFLAVHYIGVLSSTFYSARDLHFSQRWEGFLGAHAILRAAITLLTASAVFLILLLFFCKERVRFKYALWGGVVFSLFWMVAIKLFGYYLTHVARFSLLYGSLATLAIIVVWIFYSACILLLCAEFTSVLQQRLLKTSENPVET